MPRTHGLEIAAAVLACGCAGAPAERPPRPSDELVALLSGAWSNRTQAENDDEYLDARLGVAPIWTARTDGPWVYVELAAVAAPSRPMGQRVLHVRAFGDGSVRCDVFELPGDPATFAGAWTEPERFAALGPDDLRQRPGCSLFLAREGDRWSGGTRGRGCDDPIGGAAYVTTELVATPGYVTVWERGFRRNGTQTWGPIVRGYWFERVESP